MLKKLPSLLQVKSLMKKIAKENGISEQVDETWDHETVVWNFSKKIANLAIKNGYKIDLDFLKIGCYIHDLGRMISGSKASKELQPAIYHGLRGYELAKKMKWPEKIARVCIRHMGGVGQTKEVNKKIGLGNKDTLAKTIEEKILAYSDCRTFFNVEKNKADIYPFKISYNRFKAYPRVGKILMKNKEYIDKITGGKLE
ncbi:MAG: HDIG domain-containing protein [Patescibacteria group bacterium]|nr:HDIG domain-containing protein [Patescibacteria group bacterium]